MPTVDPFLTPTPDNWAKDPQINEWVFNLLLLLDNLTREDGALETSEETTEVVVTHSEKLDFVTVTQPVNLDTVESETTANTSALAALLTSLPKYTISNDGTLRTLNADDAAGTISVTPTQAEVENLRDAILLLADFVSTMNRDLQDKDIYGA